MFIPDPEPEFLTFKEAKNRFQGTNSARQCTCSLAGRYDHPIPTRFQAPIDCLTIPALDPVANNNKRGGGDFTVLPDPESATWVLAHTKLVESGQ